MHGVLRRFVKVGVVRGARRELARIADRHAAGRIVSSLEGGYNLQGLRDGVLAVLAELSGDPGCPGKVDDEVLQAIVDSDREVAVVDGFDKANHRFLHHIERGRL